eukprot:Sspe_Gene.37232::Locus_17965_Transcript_1_1_Confidence_1.000_Length_1287::g.37232::m.37232/K03514/PAPD5_7, TRF4; non-canonical poly(A) RNA polymerase PAPD5/7
MSHNMSSCSGGSSGYSGSSASSSSTSSTGGSGGHSALVTTPWFPEGAMKDRIALKDEVAGLHKLLQLTHSERKLRRHVRSVVQEAVQRVWPEATVKVYGSFAYDCSLPESGLDLVVEGWTAPGMPIEQVITELSKTLPLKEDTTYCKAPDNSQGFARLAVTGSEPLLANVTFVPGRSSCRHGVAAIQKLLEQYPVACAVFSVVRLVLQQVKCNDVSTGGLSSYAALVMVLHAAQQSSDPTNEAQVLVDFFTIFGRPIDYCVSLRGSPSGGGHAGYVEDPVSGGDLVAGCTRLRQIQSVFAHCGATLAKWSTNRWLGYRGRTPLSSILAYDALWERCPPHLQPADMGLSRTTSACSTPAHKASASSTTCEEAQL